MRRFVHHLILETYISKRPLGMYGCHDDDNRGNNSLDNLKWATPKENTADSIKNGKHIFNPQNLISWGENHPCAVLNELQVRIIKKYPKHHKCLFFLAKTFCISENTIKNIRCGSSWKHLE